MRLPSRAVAPRCPCLRDHGPLVKLQDICDEISRAGDDAIIMTDNREQLSEIPKENAGEAVTALEAVDECPDGAEIVTGIPQKESVGASPSSLWKPPAGSDHGTPRWRPTRPWPSST